MHLVKIRRLITPKIFVLLLVTLIWLVADNLLEFVFPTYLETIELSYFAIGLLLALPSISGILIDLPAGSLSDRASRKKLMIYGLVLSMISGVLIFWFKINWVLALSFLFWGVAYQLWRVPRDAQFAAYTDRANRGQFYGFDTEIKYIGQSIGPLIGGFVLLYLGFRGIVGFYVVLLFLAVLILYFFVRETNHRSMGRAMRRSVGVSALLSELKEFKVFGLSGAVFLWFSLLFTAWEQILWTFQPLFYGPDVLNIPPHLGGLLLSFFSLPGIFLSYPAGFLADRIGKMRILFFGLIVMGVSLMVFSKLDNLFLVFLFALLTAVGWTFSMPALNGLIVDLSYRHGKGKIAGLWDLFMDVGFVTGPVVGGFIAQVFNLRAVFLVLGVVFVLSALFLLSGVCKIDSAVTKK